MDHLQKVQDYLDDAGVEYEIFHHEPAYTAMEIAASQHIAGKQMIKCVLVKSKKGYTLCVLPAIHRLDFVRLRAIIGADDLQLATEEEVGKLFPECELGAEPPFGHWHGLPTVVDEILEEDLDIVFNAGTHTDTIKMRYTDYKQLAHPTIAPIGVHI